MASTTIHILLLPILLCPCTLTVIGWFAEHLATAGLPRRLFDQLSIGSAAISLACSLLLLLDPFRQGEKVSVYLLPRLDWLHLDLLLLDALSALFLLVINAIVFVAAWNTVAYLDSTVGDDQQQRAAFYWRFCCFHFTMVLVVLLNNLVFLWIAMQATTLISAQLIEFPRARANPAGQQEGKSWPAVDASWKYLIIASTGIIFALFGTALLAHAAELLYSQEGYPVDWKILNYTELFAHSEKLGQWRPEVRLGFVLVLLGYGTKAGLAPLHTWLPDGHGEAPPPISALLSGVLIKASLYAILRYYVLVNRIEGVAGFTSWMILGASLLALLVATPFILKKNAFKRILAYHSLEHMGIITFGIGIGARAALAGALMHVLNHAVTKALLFLAYGDVTRAYAVGDEAARERLPGLLRAMPYTSAIIIIGSLALVGFPPSSIFFSEFMMIWGALKAVVEPGSGGPLASLAPASVASSEVVLPPLIVLGAMIIFIATITLIFFGLSRHLYRLLFAAAAEPARISTEQPGWRLVPLGLLVSMVLILGFWIPGPLASLIDTGVMVLKGAEHMP